MNKPKFPWVGFILAGLLTIVCAVTPITLPLALAAFFYADVFADVRTMMRRKG